MSFIKHKEQSKKHWLIMRALFIYLFFISILTNPIIIHADDGNGTNQDDKYAIV